jgi:meso-butanediol dehydrogenase/(S,S)-butanediol dehydrogenase/diacetyl reductase
MSFAGKVVLVTGSTTGIGEACALLFAESAARVMVSGRDERRGRAVVEGIRAAGGSAEFTAVDLRGAGACDRLIGDTIDRLGGLDVLVNNAGILYTANALDTSDQQWLDTMAVNVNALFYLSRAAVKHMKQAGGGHRQRRFRMGAQRRSQSRGLLRQQGCGDPNHPLHGPGSCARQHPRQFRVSG